MQVRTAWELLTFQSLLQNLPDFAREEKALTSWSSTHIAFCSLAAGKPIWHPPFCCCVSICREEEAKLVQVGSLLLEWENMALGVLPAVCLLQRLLQQRPSRDNDVQLLVGLMVSVIKFWLCFPTFFTGGKSGRTDPSSRPCKPVPGYWTIQSWDGGTSDQGPGEHHCPRKGKCTVSHTLLPVILCNLAFRMIHVERLLWSHQHHQPVLPVRGCWAWSYHLHPVS